MFVLKYSDGTVNTFQRRPSHTEIGRADIVLEVDVVKDRVTGNDVEGEQVIRVLNDVAECYRNYL